ncbi:hypothetical protein L227DRAFT_403334 [Lentinus tigrinus ALCF2SS1-6]|uniref:Uncharacterized protein n=1 Tax=Lentinus tigrinus ALCF2SS1-6 TaxID=1328759 RepID=A0A5C2RSY4_9APHY|nr:hypothetical protein L227DRAFT_403334 [Lentinus tigrinus ALCF2SS1-6]
MPWDDWGRAGARVVTAGNVDLFDLSIATHGSRCVLTVLSTPLNVANLVLIDAHPWAQQCHGRGASVTLQTLRHAGYHGVKVVDSTDVHSMLTLSTSVRPGKQRAWSWRGGSHAGWRGIRPRQRLGIGATIPY